jgi:hypothetical protein
VGVGEGERDELGEAHKSVQSRRDEAAAAEVEVEKVAEVEAGGKGGVDEVAQYGSPRVKRLDDKLLDMLVDEGAELVVGAFQMVQADADN